MINYIILITVWTAMFWKFYRLGHVVDDFITYPKMQEKIKKQKINSIYQFFRVIHESLQGAGLFKSKKVDHFFSVFLHLCISLLLYNISNSFFGALLWLINPVNNQTSLWLNGRRYQVSLLLILTAFKFQLFAMPLYALACFFHISGVMFPAVLLFTDYWWVVPVLCVLAVVVGVPRFKDRFLARKADFIDGSELIRFRPKKIVLAIKSLGYYFCHILVPAKPRMYHQFLYYFGRYEKDIKQGYSLNFDFFKGLAVLGFIGFEIIVNGNIWAAWFLIFIVQWCNLVTVTQNVADRYCSFPAVGLMIVFAEYINLLPHPFNMVCFTAVITFYVMKYQPLFSAYENIFNFYEYHINIQKDCVEARTLQAERFLKYKDPYSAFCYVKTGLSYRPKDFKLLMMMGECLLHMQLFDKALAVFDIAAKYVPIGEEKDFKEMVEETKENIAEVLRVQNRNKNYKVKV